MELLIHQKKKGNLHEGELGTKITNIMKCPLVVFKDSLSILERQILKLFNMIMVVGKMPKVWKVAKIKPIFKKGDHSKIENYRPISNLNSISKAYERCLLNRLPIDAEGINQHGFK